MTPGDGRLLLEALAGRWRRRQTVAIGLRFLATSLPGAGLAAVLTPAGPGRVAAIVAAVAAAGLLTTRLPRTPRADAKRVARHFDRTLPALEESTTLLLRTDSDLRGLERLQRSRLLGILSSLDPRRLVPGTILQSALGESIAGLLLAGSIVIVAARIEPRAAAAIGTMATVYDEARGEEPFPDVSISIVPPAYTGRPARELRALDLEVADGALVTWRRPRADDLEIGLVEATGEETAFLRHGDDLLLGREVSATALYRLVARRRDEEIARTPYARLAVVPDEPPLLTVKSPAERLTVLDPEDATELDIVVRARDDYGLADATLVVTVALGSGEMVEFRERRTSLPDPGGSRNTVLRHRLDLAELGLGPAAELYFHVEARDVRTPTPNTGRTPTVIVRVRGEVATSVGLGQGIPVVLPPTYFRSQRQIIIDTERLIAQRPQLPPDDLRRRSEALGHDQRSLRMRYGALLGEEFVSGRAVDAGEVEAGTVDDEHHDETDEAVVTDGPYAGLPEGFFHAHDSSEIATFFTNDTRTQLKRVLGQMWDAEGRLRVIDPEGALPFELQALEWLKELQEASRVYVQKVGFDAPPLDPAERRLTGELDDISTRHHETEGSADSEETARIRRLVDQLRRTNGPWPDEATLARVRPRGPSRHRRP